MSSEIDKQNELAKLLFDNTPEKNQKIITIEIWKKFVTIYKVFTVEDLQKWTLDSIREHERNKRQIRTRFGLIEFVIAKPPFNLLGKPSKNTNLFTEEQRNIYNIIKNNMPEHKKYLGTTFGYCGLSKFLLSNPQLQTIEDFKNIKIIQEAINNIENRTERNNTHAMINVYYELNNIDLRVTSKFIDKKKQIDKFDVFPIVKKFAKTYPDNGEWFLNMIISMKTLCKIKNLSPLTFKHYSTYILKIFEILKNNNKLVSKNDIININKDEIMKTMIEVSNERNKLKNMLYSINLIIKTKFFPLIDSNNLINIEELILNIDKNYDVSDDENDNELYNTSSNRDYFNEEEIKKMNELSKRDVREHLIFILFSHIGLRLSGLINIKMIDIYDYDKRKFKDEGKTLEKGNKYRYFSIIRDEELVQALDNYLKIYVDVIEKKEYLFMSPYIGSIYPVGRSFITRTIKKLCSDCNIVGKHTHCHALRKSLVVKLVQLGNPIDKIAKFIGHANSKVTEQSYWVPTIDDLTDNMHIPWLRVSQHVITLSDLKLLSNNDMINIEENTKCTSSTDTGENFIYFLKHTYYPLKKDRDLLKEKLSLALFLLSKENNNEFYKKEKELEIEFINKYEKIEKENGWKNSNMDSVSTKSIP